MRAITTICGIVLGLSLAAGAYVLTHKEKQLLIDSASASQVILFTEKETAQFMAKDLEAAVGVYEGTVIEHDPEAFLWGDWDMIIESFKVMVDKTYKGIEKNEIEFIRATDRFEPRGNTCITSSGIKPMRLKVGSSYFFFITAPIHEFHDCPMLLLEQDAIPIVDGKVHLDRFQDSIVVDHAAFSDSLTHLVDRCSIPYLRDHADAIIRATLQDHIPKEGVTIDGPKYHSAEWGPYPIGVQTVISDVYKQPTGHEMKKGDSIPVIYQRAEWTDMRCMWTGFTPFKRGDDVILFLTQVGDAMCVEPALYRKWNVVGERAELVVNNGWPGSYVVESIPMEIFLQQLEK